MNAHMINYLLKLVGMKMVVVRWYEIRVWRWKAPPATVEVSSASSPLMTPPDLIVPHLLDINQHCSTSDE